MLIGYRNQSEKMKNSSIIYIIAAIIIVIAGLGWLGNVKVRTNPATVGQVASGASSDNSTLSVSGNLYDFGTISMADGEVSYVFNISNGTDKDVFLKTVNTSCMCTRAYIKNADGEKGPFGMPGMGYVPPANEIIKAGETRDVKVVFDPAAHGPAGVGPINRQIILTDNAGRVLTLNIKGMVKP